MVMNISQVAKVFHRNSPPLFIQPWKQQYSRRPFFYIAYRSFSNTIRLRSMSKFDDSMIELDKIRQIPMNYQCKLFSAFLTAHETFSNSFPSFEKFLFCTDKIESIEWLDLAPRLRIGDCSEIQPPRWRLYDLLSNFSARGTLLRQCVFCKEAS